MFYDKFKYLCEEKGITVTRATEEIGLSRTIGTKWKNTGATPSGETLTKIATYFNVSVDYLLGHDPIAAPHGPPPPPQPPRQCYIYAIQCKANKRVYVGMTVDIVTRLKTHYAQMEKGQHPNKLLMEDVKRYGMTEFEFFELESCVKYNQRFDRERHYIELYRSSEPKYGYNLTAGSTAGIRFTINRQPPPPPENMNIM